MNLPKKFFHLVVLLFLFSFTIKAQVKDTTFSFTISSSSKTSAGIYKGDGTLVRTLWGGVEYTSGTHQFKWDGKDDFGVSLPDEKYTAKVLSNNVQYEWEGVVGNTSTAQTGSTKLRMFDPLTGMAHAGDKIYWAGGYNEGWPATYKTSITDPNSKIWIPPMKQTNAVVDYVCTDGSRVYWTGYDPFDDDYESFVFATNVSNDERVAFTEGVPASMGWGGTYPNAIGYKRTPRSTPSKISGIAVQMTGLYLFISRKGLNEIQVLNKTTGEVVQTLTMTLPAAMKVDHSDNLWLAHNNVVEKFIVNTNGTLSSTSIIIRLPKANAIAISPDNTTVSINDIASGKVKSYSGATGAFLWELGRTQNYMDDATVYDDKFYWKDINKEYHTFLSYMPDGTLYVGDPQNRRVQHFAVDRTYIDNIMYQSSMYNTETDANDPTRLYADYFEFKIDYSKPLQRGNGSWKLVKNWGANIESKYDHFEKMKYITTFPNGRTYGRLRIENRYYLTELVEGGTVRINPVALPQFTSFDLDGSKLVKSHPVLGQQGITQKYRITGYDSSGNPIWSTTPEILATTPASNSTDPFGVAARELTSTNKLIFYDPDKSENGHGEGYHLGAVEKGGTKWLWRTALNVPKSYTGPFPSDGSFDSGNGVIYAGGPILISDQNIFWGYHGEFWKQSQTNKWNHVHDSGLFVGQWGTLKKDHYSDEAVAGNAGNTLSGSVAKVNGITYIYHNDESVHGGVHRWKVSNLNSIQIQNAIPTTLNATAVGTDLLAGLVRGESLKNGAFGWTRDITADYTNSEEFYKAVIGQKSYDIFKNPDLFITQSRKSGSSNITRTLGTNSDLVSWKLEGKISYDTHTPNEPAGRGGGYMEILDKNDLLIARFYVNRNALTGTDLIANGQILYNSTSPDLFMLLTRFQPVEISGNNGSITFKYANYSLITGLQDRNADWKSPSKLRFNFFTNNPADNHTRSISISELHFYANNEAILKSKQTVIFSDTLTKVYANTPLKIVATASSGLPVVVKIISGPGSINGNVLNFSGYGTVKLQADQAGNTSIEAATATLDIINSPKIIQTITFTNTPTLVTGSSPVTFKAVASSGLPVTFKIISGPGNITGSVLNFSGYGTVKLQVDQVGSASIEAATATIDIVNSPKYTQTITFTNTPSAVNGSTPVAFTAASSSGLPVTFSVVSGPGSITGNVLNFNSYGTVRLKADQSGNNLFEPATTTIDIINSTKTLQTITFSNTPTAVIGSIPVTFTAISSSGLPVTFSIISGPGTITGNVLNFNGYGTVKLQANQSGNATIEAASATVEILNSPKTHQTITFTNTPAAVSGSIPVTFTAVASSGLPISYSLISGPGSIKGNILTFNGYGTVKLQASQAGNAGIEAASATIDILNTSKTVQTVSFQNTPDNVYGNTSVTVTAVASSGLSTSLKVVSGPGIFSGNTLSFTGYGSVTISATQSGSNTIESASFTKQIVNNPKIVQIITFDDLPNTVFSNSPLQVNARASSGLPVSYKVLSGPGVLQGNVLSFDTFGTVKLQATHAGNNQYEAAIATITIIYSSKKSQTIVFTYPPSPLNRSVAIPLTAVASSGLPVVLSVVSGPAVIDGNMLSFTGHGTVIIRASQAGNEIFEAASATISIADLLKSNQTIVYTNTLTAVTENIPVTVTATASSGLPVSYRILSGPGTFSGNIFSFTGTGAVTIEAIQPGNDNFSPATATLTITYSAGAKQKTKQSITFEKVQTEVSGMSPVKLTPIATSGLPVTLEVISGDAYLSGDLLNFTSYGEVTVKAVQFGNEEIEAAAAEIVLSNKPASIVKVFPNPVIDNDFNIQLTNLLKGIYVASLTNLAGQIVFSTSLKHEGESANYKINIDQPIPPGICVLNIKGAGISFNQKVIKN